MGQMSADALSEKKVSGSLANLPVNVEGKSGDPLPYSLLPIIIPNMSKESSLKDVKGRGNDEGVSHET